MYTVKEVEDAIDIPSNKWSGNCYAIAAQMWEKGLVEGKVRYGHWLGPISDKSTFRKLLITPHGWIETKEGIVDPTRWVFEAVEPYIYFGPNDYYDAGGNVMRFENMKPCPEFNPNSGIVELELDQDTLDFIYSLAGYEILTKEVCFWLANLPIQVLGGYVKPIYQALEKAKMRAFIPIDNYRMVIDG